MINEIEEHRAELGAPCRRLHVQKLDVFGSAARGDFDPQQSDFDFIVAFERGFPFHPFDAYFELKEGLEALLGGNVDLVMDGTIENPYRKASVERSRELVYAG